MLQTVSSLNAVKEWLEGHISADKIQLKVPSADNKIGDYKLAAPAVHAGLIPPDGIIYPTDGIRIPCLVVGTPETNGDSESTEMELQITAIVYDPGTQTPEISGPKLIPNFDGYITLLNFLDRVKEWVQREDGAAGRFQLESPVKLKTYEDQPWPYWYGFLSFTVSGEPYPVTKYADVLN